MGAFENAPKLAQAKAITALLKAGRRQTEVADLLDIKDYAVARLKAYAIREGLLVERAPAAGPAWTDRCEAEAAEVLRGPIELELVQLFAVAERAGFLVRPAYLRVVPALAPSQDRAQEWAVRLREFGRMCASDIMKAAANENFIGVSWGATVASVIDGLERIGDDESSKRAVRRVVFPVCGEPIGDTGNEHSTSATMLASRFSRCVNGQPTPTLSLTAVPSFIPLDFADGGAGGVHKDEVKIVRKLIARVPGHSRIFGFHDTPRTRGEAVRRPLVSRMSMLLTSVSREDAPFGGGEHLNSAGIKLADVRAAAAGEISGALLARPPGLGLKPASADDVRTLDLLASHWTGITGGAVADCAARARAKGASGVCVLALGKKLESVGEAVRQGLVNQLYVDSELADLLRDWLKKLLGV